MKHVRKSWPKNTWDRWKSFRGYDSWDIPLPDDPDFIEAARKEIDQANYRAVLLLTDERDILSQRSEKQIKQEEINNSLIPEAVSPDIAIKQVSSFSRSDFFNALDRATRKVA